MKVIGGHVLGKVRNGHVRKHVLLPLPQHGVWEEAKLINCIFANPQSG